MYLKNSENIILFNIEISSHVNFGIFKNIYTHSEVTIKYFLLNINLVYGKNPR